MILHVTGLMWPACGRAASTSKRFTRVVWASPNNCASDAWLKPSMTRSWCRITTDNMQINTNLNATNMQFNIYELHW